MNRTCLGLSVAVLLVIPTACGSDDGGGASGTGGASSGGASSGGASSGGASSGGTGGAGTGGAGTGGAGTGGAGTGGSTGSCTATNGCSSPADLGTVSGDSGSASASQKASGTRFFRVRVTEDDNSVLGAKLKLAASLAVPSGTDYDLYAYLNTTSDSMPSCSSPSKSSAAGGVGANEQLGLSWGEGSIANGNDDGRWVVVEVRHKAGPCGTGSQYTLTVTGN
ncbi:MAG: hypothetical protein HYZ29_27735 [Myxococcales bacterium]|nr:hypothetical protein [Myxococcales bacterium]